MNIIFKRFASSSSSTSSALGETFVNLFPQEKRLNIHDPVVTTATTFSGTAPINFLEERCKEIVQANPWLNARLVSNPTTREPCLSFSKSESTAFYEHVPVLNASGQLYVNSFESLIEVFGNPPPMRKDLASLFCKQGIRSLDEPDEPLFKVRLLTGSNPSNFVLLCSMSHVFGDGNTFYSIYRMLDPSEKVVALCPERVEAYPEKLGSIDSIIPGSNYYPPDLERDPVHATKNQCKLDWALSKKIFSPESLLQAPPKGLGFGMRYINKDWIEEEKKKHLAQNDVPYLSTNDILASWFFRINECDAGVFAVDGRQDFGITAKAGNYQNFILYYPEEFSSPAGIRRSRMDPKGWSQKDSKPGPGTRVGVLSNWTANYMDVNYQGCQQIAHFPLSPAELGLKGMREPGAIIFNPTADTLALAGASTNWKDMDASGALGEPVSLFN